MQLLLCPAQASHTGQSCTARARRAGTVAGEARGTGKKEATFPSPADILQTFL